MTFARASDRLFLFSRQHGWVPALVWGTDWDAEQIRIQYRARGICTAWFKGEHAS